jgi:hypothetical protein
MISGIYEKGGPQKMYLRLRKDTKPNIVMLCVVDEKGDPLTGGNLIGFDMSKQGFRLCENVSHEFGLELDSRDRIVIHG